MHNSVILKNLEESQKTIKVCDHLVYVSYSLIKDKKILLKVVEELKKAILCGISASLQYEYLYNRINLVDNSKKNLETFIAKLAPKYSINPKDVKKTIELLELVEKHKKSAMEFQKDSKVIILSKNLSIESLSLEKTKEFLESGKNILRKIEHFIIDGD